MAMVCPQCHNSFEQGLQCPKCGVALIQQDVPPPSGSVVVWQQTPWGRILVGVLLAQGLSYGLRQLCLAIRLMVSDDPTAEAAWWSSLPGHVLSQGTSMLALLLGGMLAGAGKRRGIVFGAVVGLWNGVLSVLIPFVTKQPLSFVALCGQPILHTAFGALGGYIGSLIWKSLHSMTVLPLPAPGRAPATSAASKSSPVTEPVAWVRVLAGIAVAVGGTVWANVIFEFIVAASRASLDKSEEQLVTWQLSVLAMLVGGALAGVTRPNGAKQGLLVGLGAGAVIFGVYVRGSSAPPQTLILTLADIRQGALETFLVTIISTVVLGLLGGWFGSQLLPPASGRRRRIWGTAR